MRKRLHLTDAALDLFLWSRADIWLAAVFAYAWFEPKPPPLRLRWDDPALHDVGWATDLWARWDSAWYLGIAEHGYGAREGAAAFYPLYPALVGGLGRVFGGHYVLAGVVVSLAACLAAFVLLHRLALPLVGPGAARRALLYLAIFPTTIFLQAVYAESLFLALAVAVFVLAERGRLWWAAGAAGLACLTRPTGVALLPALALYAWRGRALPSLVVVPGLFVGYPLFLWWRIDDPWAFASSQDLWHRHASATGLWDAVRAVFTAERLHDTAVDAAGLVVLVLFAALAVVAWRRLGATYGLYALGALALPVAVPSSRYPLLSMPRFALVAFPCFLALGLLGGRERTHTAVVVACAAFLGVVIVQWVRWQWVS